MKKAPSLTPEEKTARRLRARHRFRAIVRLAIENLYWLDDDDNKTISDDVKRNIQLFSRKKTKKSALTIQEKSILNKQKEYRTEEDKQILNRAIGGLKCFRRYPSDVKRQLAAVTYFCYFGPGHNIVKQYHKPHAMYFMMAGEASVTVRRFDKVINEWVEEVTGTISAGTMFGEVALLHGIYRLATITTITPCEFLMIKKEDFDLVLKETVLKAWEEIQRIMNKYTYFKNWDSVTKRECSIVSRTKSFEPEETILGDGVGIPSCVYFVTKGSCHIIEHMHLAVKHERGIKKYELHIPKEDTTRKRDDPTLSLILKKYLIDKITQASGDDKPEDTKDLSEEPIKSNTSLPPRMSVSMEMPSSEYFKYNPSMEHQLETHFIRVCELTEGACFSIGESFQRRRVVATLPTNCLLVPRYWILKNNKDNIWGMVQQFLNQHIPSTEKIFQRYMEEQKFIQYGKNLIRDLLRRKKISNDNSIHNIPYSIRLKQGVDVNYHIHEI